MSAAAVLQTLQTNHCQIFAFPTADRLRVLEGFQGVMLGISPGILKPTISRVPNQDFPIKRNHFCRTYWQKRGPGCPSLKPGGWALPWARSFVLFTSLSLSDPGPVRPGGPVVPTDALHQETNHPQEGGSSPPKVMIPH